LANPIRVLIVEDSADDAELMLRALDNHGFASQADRVETEAAYLSGLDAAPDVIFADYRLPQFSGLRALELLNERRLDIPFIVVSGDIGNEEAAGLIKLGASDFLHQDRLARLGLAVTQALELKRARDERRLLEEALVKSNQRFRSMIESTSDLVIVIERRGVITYVSPSLKQIGGYEAGEALDQNFLEFIHPEDVPGFNTALSSILRDADSRSVTEELRFRHKDGSWLTLETIARNALDDSGIAGVVLNARDITERRRAELAMLQHELRIEGVIASMAEGIVSIDETLRIVLFNPAAEQMFGRSREEVLGQPLSALIPERFRPQHEEHIRRFAATRQTNRAMGKYGLIYGLRASGEEFPSEATISQTGASPNKLLTVILRDITERKKQEQNIARLNRIHAVLSGINSLIVRVRDRQELFNKACRIAVEHGGFGIAWIGVLNQETLEITPAACAGVDAESFLARSPNTARADTPMGQGVVGRAIRERRAVSSDDITTAPGVGGERRKEATRRGYRSSISLPLLMEGAAVGNFSLFAKEANFFTADEVKLLTELAGDISFALEHIAKEEKITRLSRIEAVMSAINSLIVRVGDRQALFDGACRIAIEQGGFGIAWIGVLNQETLEITPAACAGVDAESLLAHSPNTARPDTPLGQGAVGRAIREKRAVFSNDITTEPGVGGERRKEAVRRGYRSVISLPLLMEGAAVGNLSLFAKEANFFTADEVKLLTELADNITFALQAITRQEKLEKLSRIRAVSSEINAAIVRIRERETLLRETCRIAAEQGKFELVWIASLDPEKQEVRPVAWIGFSPDAARSVNWATINSARGTLAEAIQTRRTAVHNDIDAGLQGGVLRQEAISKGCLSTVCMPLMADDKVVALCALFAPGQGFFDTDELALLDELAADVSFALEYIAKEEKLNYLAYHDVLTGLPNRALFDDRMAQSLRAASHENSKTALVLIDLERFRVINDTLGRGAADDLLKLVATRLQSVIFDRDSLARIHADVFAGLFPDINDEADIARIVEEKIIACLSQPFTVAGQELRVSMKAGVALFPGDATEPDALFSSAEAALRQAKDSSDRYLFYAPKMNAMVAERLKLENKLQRALERNEFMLFYQPKVDLNTGRVAGLEALIRWNDPGTGLVLPSLFIPLLEETGMIVEVGAWAMKRAVTQHEAWQAAGLQPPPIAVNVSQVQLKRKDFVTSVQQAIAIAGKPEHGLDLEITESMIMEDIESSIEKLKIIRALGVEISIDDFGTGYSSLRYLTRLPITALKIDRAFVQDMTTNPDNMAIVSTIITLARTLKLKVIAEGVETEEQSKFLRLLKCDQFQGYLFSKPVPAEQVPALLARGGRADAAQATGGAAIAAALEASQ